MKSSEKLKAACHWSAAGGSTRGYQKTAPGSSAGSNRKSAAMNRCGPLPIISVTG